MGEVLKYLDSKFQQKTSCNRCMLSNILIWIIFANRQQKIYRNKFG